MKSASSSCGKEMLLVDTEGRELLAELLEAMLDELPEPKKKKRD